MKQSELSQAFLLQIRNFAAQAKIPLIINGASQTLPTQGVYLAEALLPGATERPGYGADSYKVQRGIYQVDVRCPRGSGRFALLATADKVSELFARNKKVAYNNTSAKVVACSVSGVRFQDNYQAVAVSVQYIAVN